MSGDSDSAITTLTDGLKPDRPQVFVQADALVSIVPFPVYSDSLSMMSLSFSLYSSWPGHYYRNGDIKNPLTRSSA
jgi:hypothetical protein